ncbi:S8 family serine peptidase [Haloarchaeobius sp. HRN-SO-5]|uniref:S8 family serine peptidase n=1 Tax=Haloarchaeobius sp. HRN-SO-5 TaxID=3446118 RepID=UPI003EBB0B6D
MLREQFSQGERMNRKLLALLLAGLLVLGTGTPFVAAGAPSTQQAGTQAEIVQTGVGDDADTNTVAGERAPDASPASIDPVLERSSGTVEVVVRLSEAPTSATSGRDATIDTLQRHADRTQQSVLEYAHETEGVSVENTFWITNAVLLEVDRSEVDLDAIAHVEHVNQLHANFDLSLPEGADARSDPVGGDDYNTTYGLDQVNATEVWDQYGTMGEGAKVAVLDTGVDVGHPDIDLYTENASDPTYPGGWAEFDDSGNQVPGSEPHDTDTHGTHTSGTVSGGNASGEYIGVAPNVDLMHGLVIPAGGGSFAQVAGGMEWAVQEDADVVSMSLGATGYYTEMIEPIQNAEDAGTVFAISSGNSGEGSSSSPGNVWDAVAVGASDVDANVASFSSGEEVDTSSAWGSDAPDHWPDTYVVPDVAAPGVAVKSSVPGGGYAEYDGTSMAAPHVAGVVALMESAAGPGQLTNSQIRTALRDSAWKPEGEPAGNDTRYGAGIVDALEATTAVALEQGVNGTVTDASGTPVEGATVSIDGGGTSTTAADGSYTLLATNGTHDVTADEFGYESQTRTVTVEGDYAVQNFSLNETLDVALVDGQRSAIAAGENVSVTVDVANLESVTVDAAGTYDTSNATLYVAGQEATFGDPVTFDAPYTGQVTVTVVTAADATGELSLEHTFEGLGDAVSVTTGPTAVFSEYYTVGIVDDDGAYGDDVASTLHEELSAQYEFSVVSSVEAVESVDAYDGFVVQNVENETQAGALADATDGVETGVVWLDNWGSDSNGIPMRSGATGDPASTGDAYGDGVVSYEALGEHPVLDGVVAPGERVQLHTATVFNDHSWFDGSNGDVLADLHTGDAGVKGPGLAVYEDRRTVLASTLGREFFVEDGEFTAEADQILANAVTWSAQPPEPAGTIDVTESEVQPGESTTLTVLTDDVDDVSGYQFNLSFDPDKLQVTGVSGVEFADPVVDVDNEEGYVSFAQAQAEGIDGATFADVHFDVLMDDRGTTADVSWQSDGVMVTYPNGTAPYVDWSDGVLHGWRRQHGRRGHRPGRDARPAVHRR